MIPQLKALLGPSGQEIALRDVYFKMYLFLRSAITMNRLDHFQSVAALTRSLFELLLDLKILARDKTGDALKRYNDFPEIERYRRAEQLVKFDASNPNQIKQDLSAQRAFISDPQRQARVRSAIGPKGKYPDHWTGKNARKRARSTGEEPLYVEVVRTLELVRARGSRWYRRNEQGRLGVRIWRMPRPHSADFPRRHRDLR
jgi:hypothetical protein